MGSVGKNLSRRRTGTPRKHTLSKCSTSGEVDEFVLIDLDSDIPDVIIIDIPLPSKKLKKPIIDSPMTSKKKPSPHTVINIDDDDEPAGGVCSNDDDSISSTGCPSKPMDSSNFSEANHKNYSFVDERNSPVNLSKHRHNYSGKAGSSVRYGLGSESESWSIESDCSDSECMESMDDPTGKLREQWELASKRRKTATHASASNPVHRSFHDGENAANETYVSDQSSPTHIGHENKRKYEENAFPSVEPECAFENSLNEDDKQYPSDDCATAFPDQGPSSPNIEDASGPGSFSMENSSSPLEDLETKISTEPCLFNRQPSFDEQFDCGMAEPLKKDPSVSKSHLSGDDDRKCDRRASMDVDEEQPTSSFCGTHFDKTSKSTSFWNFKSNPEVDMVVKTAADCEEPELICLDNHQKAETGYRFHSSIQTDAEGSTYDLFNGLTFTKTNDVRQDPVKKPCQNDIIIDRQRIKETDEYKRAMEEELKARQRQLQIQAEEAQRMRRRKRAETKRVMDVERRQKQRLEEVRETQRRDEANLNMKEKLRSEIMRELNLVERSCMDMASVLRRLGVPVNGGMLPSQNEVQAAYKRAVLKFHPDRASRTDIRQQVEAEEKFKLISRMKEKYPLA